MLTAAGSGYSRWSDLGVTRWREDATRDDSGSYIYLRDVDSGAVWSAGYQPTRRRARQLRGRRFTEDRAEFIRSDGDADHHARSAWSRREDDAEVRRLSHHQYRRADARDRGHLLCRARPGAARPPTWRIRHSPSCSCRPNSSRELGALLAHAPTPRSRRAGDLGGASRRRRRRARVGAARVRNRPGAFLGRGRELRAPLAVLDGRPLSDTAGTVLDPVFALRHRVRIPRGDGAHRFWTLRRGSRAKRARPGRQASRRHARSSARATLAWTQAQVQLRHLGIDADEANLFQRLAGHILFADAAAAAVRRQSRARRRPDPRPVGAGYFRRPADRAAAHRRRRGPARIVRAAAAGARILAASSGSRSIWSSSTSAAPPMCRTCRSRSKRLVRISQARPQHRGHGQRGKVFVLRADLIPPRRARCCSPSRACVLVGRARHARRAARAHAAGAAPWRRGRRGAPGRGRAPRRRPEPAASSSSSTDSAASAPRAANTSSTLDRRPEHARALDQRDRQSAASASRSAADGGGYTWARQQPREPAHALVQRSGRPTARARLSTCATRRPASCGARRARPIRDDRRAYTCAHGMGYSRFEHDSHGIALELPLFVPLDDPIKICAAAHAQRLAAPAQPLGHRVCRVGAGPVARRGAPHIVTELDRRAVRCSRATPGTQPFAGACFRRSAGRADASGPAIDASSSAATACSSAGGAGNRQRRSPGRVGAGLDPCGALRAPIELEPGEHANSCSCSARRLDATKRAPC